MSKRRSRTRRSDKKIMGMSNTTFAVVSIILIAIIVMSIVIMHILHEQEVKKIAEEKERINAQVEEIYKATNEEIASVDTYKTNSIIRISAVGDILCGANLEQYGKQYDNIFTDIKKYFKDADFSLGTYETDIKGDKANFAKSVKNSGIDFASLAHNHALDYGKDGLDETDEYLKSIEIDTVGVYKETAEERVKIIEKRKIKIAILAYTYDNGKEGVNIFNEEIVKADLEYAKENATFTIVMMHWGNVDSNEISKQQEEQANFLVDNGANIIIGAHPSCIQKMEIKQNKDGKDCLVAYSLGDYTSDFESENANLELILNMQIFIDREGNASIYKVDYTPVYMIDLGNSLTENRFKILDMKKEIAIYGTEESKINKETYDKLVKGIDRLQNVIAN